MGKNISALIKNKLGDHQSLSPYLLASLDFKPELIVDGQYNSFSFGSAPINNNGQWGFSEIRNHRKTDVSIFWRKVPARVRTIAFFKRDASGKQLLADFQKINDGDILTIKVQLVNSGVLAKPKVNDEMRFVIEGVPHLEDNIIYLNVFTDSMTCRDNDSDPGFFKPSSGRYQALDVGTGVTYGVKIERENNVNLHTGISPIVQRKAPVSNMLPRSTYRGRNHGSLNSAEQGSQYLNSGGNLNQIIATMDQDAINISMDAEANSSDNAGPYAFDFVKEQDGILKVMPLYIFNGFNFSGVGDTDKTATPKVNQRVRIVRAAMLAERNIRERFDVQIVNTDDDENDKSYLVVREGTVFHGVGEFLGVDGLEESSDLSAKGCTISLSGVNLVTEGARELLILALNNDYQGRNADIYFGVHEDTDIEPLKTFAGFMDTLTVQDSAETAIITVNAESRVLRLNRGNNLRYTVEGHKKLLLDTEVIDEEDDFDDTFLSFINDLQTQKLVWGGKEE